jgi:hypothetical protein
MVLKFLAGLLSKNENSLDNLEGFKRFWKII